jgi:hypothetical protein
MNKFCFIREAHNLPTAVTVAFLVVKRKAKPLVTLKTYAAEN